jgi:RHS repeat-associated protein
MKTKYILQILTIIIVTYGQITAQTRTLNTSLPVGTTAGNAAVSQSGAATYSIPIFVSPGTNGMQPSLSVNYNSQAGVGLLGLGWGLSGISAITRAPANYYFDGMADPVDFDSNDRFTLDGQRLIATSGTYGAVGTEYHTEMENFTKVYSYGTAGSGPAWFKAVTKTGDTLEFGNTADSRVEATGKASAIFWYINKITDARGNYMTFTYTENSSCSEAHIAKIEYTGNKAANLAVYNSVTFSYQAMNRPKPINIGGVVLTQQYVINKIQTLNGTTPVREYNFRYTTTGDTKLLEVTEKDKNGTAFNSTLVDWGATTAPFTITTSNFDNDRLNYIYYGDYNGDGRTDLFVIEKILPPDGYSSADLWKMYTAGTYGTTFTLAAQGNLHDLSPDWIKVVDLNADGKDDILMGEPGNLNYVDYYPYYSTGSGFIKGDRYIHASWDPMQICNIHGNGIPDILVTTDVYPPQQYSPWEYKMRLYSYSTDPTDHLPYEGIEAASWDYIPLSWPDYSADINGDGKSEIIYTKRDTAMYWYGFDLTEGYLGRLTYKRHTPGVLFPGDFNGDGITEFLFYQKSDKTWHMNIGGSAVSSLKKVDPSASEDDNNIFIRDFNGDGKDDILEVYRNYVNGSPVNSTFKVLYGNEKGEFHETYDVDSIIFSNTLISKNNIEFGDFNGDGRIDIFYRSNYLDPYTVIFFHQNEKSHLVNTITNGMNHVIRFNYQTLSLGGTGYTKSSNSVFPVFDFQGPLYVATSVSLEYGSNINTTHYYYEGAKIHRQGKGFLGFSKVISYAWSTGIKQEDTYAFDNDYYHVYLKQSKTYTNSGTQISEANYTMSFHDLGNKRYLPYVSATTSYDRLDNTTTTSSAVVNTNGELTSSLVNSNGLATKTTSYRSYNSMGLPGMVTTTSTRTGETNYVARDSIQYYSNGLVKLKITEPGDSTQVYTSYTYNGFGNLTRVETSPDGVKGRAINYQYDSKGRMPVKTVNEAGHFTMDSLDFALGVVLETKDHNNLVTRYGYDGFGRLTQTIAPNGNTSVIAYQWYTGSIPANARYSVSTTTPGAPFSRTYYDILGRVVCNETRGLDGIQKIRSETSYNSKGEVVFVTEPYYEGTSNADRTSYTYDFLGRVKTVTAPGVDLEYTYTGLTTTIKDKIKNQTEIREYDATGLTKTATNHITGAVNYTYNAQGQARLVNTMGNNILMGYDRLGRQTALRDPNAGAYSYKYNTYGELTRQADTLNNISTIGYDSLGRTKSKAHSDCSFSYSYYPNGLPEKIVSTNVTAAYTYDALNRLKSKTENIKGMALNTKYAYDSYNRIDTLTYPSGFAVKYIYKNGYLEEIKRADNGASIWKVTGMNPGGQVATSVAGNNLTTTRTYNNRGALLTIVTGSGGTVQNLDYTYNTKEQLYSRTDKRHNNITETFVYDELNRLISVTSANPQGIEYYYNGSIAYKTDAGYYNYASETLQAVESTERGSDAGRYSPQSITYTSFNKLKTIADAKYSAAFTYGPDYQRRYVEITPAASHAYKKYYGDNYEKIVSYNGFREMNYIFAGSQIVAIFEQYNGSASGNMYYVHTDHLGSLNVITDQGGAIVSEMSFDAWGNRRDPATWKNYKNGITASSITSRGFTGHEHIDEFGLINMNGRVYDPVLGVFLSPDNVVQAPDYSQSYNRYTYCLNNPLAYTDPSGYTWWSHFKGWLKEGFDNLGDWMTKNNINFQIGYSTGLSSFWSGTPFISGTTANGHNVSVGYNTSTNQVGVGTNNYDGGFTDFYYIGENYGAPEQNAAAAINDAREFRQFINGIGDGLSDAFGNVANGFVGGARSTWGFVKHQFTLDGMVENALNVSTLGLYGQLQTLDGAATLAQNIPSYTAADYEYATGFLLEKGVEALLFKKIGSIGSVETGGRVFWSGGNVAKTAAADFAQANGMNTLEMTTSGRIMNTISPYLPRSISGPIWDRLSSNFASGATGEINVFQNGAGVGIKSTWRRIEYPILKNNNIIYHIVK